MLYYIEARMKENSLCMAGSLLLYVWPHTGLVLYCSSTQLLQPHCKIKVSYNPWFTYLQRACLSSNGFVNPFCKFKAYCLSFVRFTAPDTRNTRRRPLPLILKPSPEPLCVINSTLVTVNLVHEERRGVAKYLKQVYDALWKSFRPDHLHV